MQYGRRGRRTSGRHTGWLPWRIMRSKRNVRDRAIEGRGLAPVRQQDKPNYKDSNGDAQDNGKGRRESGGEGGDQHLLPLSSLEKETVSRFKSASPPTPVFPLYPSHPHPFPCSFYSFFPHPLLSFSALGCLFLPPLPRGEIEDTLLPPSLGIPAASWGLPLPPAVPAAPLRCCATIAGEFH